jgi:hypothetical protein
MELLVNSFKQKVSYFFNVLERLISFKVYRVSDNYYCENEKQNTVGGIYIYNHEKSHFV